MDESTSNDTSDIDNESDLIIEFEYLLLCRDLTSIFQK